MSWHDCRPPVPLSGARRPFSFSVAGGSRIISFSTASESRRCAMASSSNGAAHGQTVVGPRGREEGDYRFPASTKVYVSGALHPAIRVPMREIRLSATRGHNGAKPEENPPLRVYDTSGPYTDPDAATDLHQGLP